MQIGCCVRQTCTDPILRGTQLTPWSHTCASAFASRLYPSLARSPPRPRSLSLDALLFGARKEFRASFSTTPLRLLRYRPASGRLYLLRYHRPQKQTTSIDGQDVSRHNDRPVQYRQNDQKLSTDEAESWNSAPSLIKNFAPFTNKSDASEATNSSLVKRFSNKAVSKASRISRKHASLEELEAELQWQVRHNPHPVPVRAILALLITKHNVVPTQRHYEALLLSNCSPSGSAESVREILTEMEVAGIDLSTSVLTSALNALAIHPQSTLAADIVALLSQRQSNMPSELQHCLVVSAIRTHQLELANALLNDIHASQKALAIADREPVPCYLYIMFVQYLVNGKDYDAVIRLIYKLRERNAVDMDLPPMLWSWVLEKSTRDGDEWVSTWIWREWVEKMRVRPSRETCHHMLRIASREAKPVLAESVKDSILFGGIDPSSSIKHDKDRLPMNELSAHEMSLIHDSYRDGPIPGHDAGVSKPNRGKGSPPGNDISRPNHVRSGNMWRLFNGTSDQGIGRCDPWGALGPKARRR